MNQKNDRKRNMFFPFLFTLFLAFCVALFFWMGLLIFLTGCPNTKEIAPQAESGDTPASASSLQTALAGQVLRLHIIADSNSDADQTVKLAVRDAVITYLKPYLEDVTTKQEALDIIEAQMDELRETANHVLAENGFSYTADARLGHTYFPVKVYGDLVLPAGEYDALKICLGSASGKNWWCLVFPQLCFVDITTGTLPEDSKEELRELLTEEEYALVFPDEAASDPVAAGVKSGGQTCRILFDRAPRETEKTQIRFPLLEWIKKLFSSAVFTTSNVML
ncbi:MAG: stage II sporulation protein R [Lachnospiraceae bacterium]|nr:stage II sporulation protein R [Lachnospiraceae bacterium]